MSQPLLRATPARFRLSVLALASIGLLSGCSNAPATGVASTTAAAAATVASLPRTGTATPIRTTAAAVEGPLIRYDTSEEEFLRLYRVYNACLRKEGAPVQGDKGLSQDPETLARYKTEVAACASKRPESVPDRDKRKNPGAFQDHLREQVSCMRANGLEVVLIPPDGWGVSDEAAARGYVPNARVVAKCQLQAFGG